MHLFLCLPTFMTHCSHLIHTSITKQLDFQSLHFHPYLTISRPNFIIMMKSMVDNVGTIKKIYQVNPIRPFYLYFSLSNIIWNLDEPYKKVAEMQPLQSSHRWINIAAGTLFHGFVSPGGSEVSHTVMSIYWQLNLS